MISWKRGATREVILIGQIAVKLPSIRSWRMFLIGLLSNQQEALFGRTGWPELCPVIWSAPGGWLVVMRRAAPLTDAEWRSFDHREFCSRRCGYAEANIDLGFVAGMMNEPESGVVPAENKRCSFGTLGGRTVAVDYG